MPLFELIEVIWLCLSHVHMGSVFPLDLILFYFLTFSKPSNASKTRQWICFPAGAHSVDPAAECIDADTSPESESGEQQQQQPAATTTCWSLSPFSKAESAGVL